jgi:hypothetical protein
MRQPDLQWLSSQSGGDVAVLARLQPVDRRAHRDVCPRSEVAAGERAPCTMSGTQTEPQRPV